MKLGKRFTGWAFASAGAGLAVLIAASLLGLNMTAPAAQPAGAEPVLRGSMGDFSYFEPPRPVPPISFVDASNQSHSLADYKGRVVLVNFWATWCAPCVREMPSLDRLQAALGGRDFLVLDLSLDREGKAAVEPYFTANKLTHLGVYLDPKGEAFRAWQGQGVPTSFIIGRDGLARGVMLGPADWSSAAAVALIRHFMDEGGGAGTGAAPVQHTSTPPPAAG
ncbi:MAG TPA: TlpA disulfide reductase family protein [Alphaproteobacteria bacterium]|nr:TlpA disulfide reductase family protein [Alphaproteobacteria bacterium]